MQAPRVPQEDLLKALEAEAYEAAEDETTARGKYREYADIGPAVYEERYRAAQLGAWPPDTDFSPDNLRIID